MSRGRWRAERQVVGCVRRERTIETAFAVAFPSTEPPATCCVSIAAHGLSKRAIGKIVFISPILDKDTHSARVVAEIANPDGNWRPGSLVHAAARPSPLPACGEREQSVAAPNHDRAAAKFRDFTKRADLIIFAPRKAGSC